MAYTGELNVDPKLLYPAQHFVVMLPKTIQFIAAPGTSFKSMQNPKDQSTAVQVASNTQIGDPLGFKISGTGLLAEAESGGDAEAVPQGRDNRPGGGLGEPINSPRALSKSTTILVIVMFGLALIGGAIFAARRPAVAGGAPAPKSVSAGSALLDALKDELFQLEMEHKQGSISQEEYAKAKNALDQTLERALKRKPTA
jgi:hypothetical protein